MNIIKENKMKVQLSMPRLTRDERLENLIKEATQFFAKELMTVRMMNTIKIKIDVRKTTLDKNTWGQVINKCMGSVKQKEFRITLDYNRFDTDILRTLAHEMIHVEQIVSGRLQYRYWKSDHQLHARWEGKELGVKSHIPYEHQPWEIEAFGKEEAIFQKYYFHGRTV
jgi:RecA/RadA recombinase